MKKLFLLPLITMLSWTCSTDLDVLDDWEETTVVYCILDQTQSLQYIRIEKAFLGPENALSMAQEFDSINYINQLMVTVDALDNNGNVVLSYSTTDQTVRPITLDTVPKDYGIFAGPVLLYVFDTPPGDPVRALNANYSYRLTVTNNSTQKTVTSTTKLVTPFLLTAPSFSSPLPMVPTTNSPTIDIKWNGVSTGYVYHTTVRFFYTEHYVNGDSAQLVTSDWVQASVEPSATGLTSPIIVKLTKEDFYRFVGNSIQVNSNVVKRRADHLEITVYAGNFELKNYIDINGASNSVAQEHPIYTNINGGYGLFAARTRAVRAGNLPYNYTLSQKSIDGDPVLTPPFKGLVSSPYTCQLRFETSDHSTVPGCI
jgi:hypothetical protein